MLYGILEISIDLFGCQCAGGDERIRTADPLLAKQVLSQLSYIPWVRESRYSDIETDVSLRVRNPNFAGGPSDLESLKSGKDRNKTLVCTQISKTDGFSPRTEPPPAFRKMRSRAFGTITLRRSLSLLA